MENHGTIFRHDQQGVQDGKDKGGKARKSKWGTYKKNSKVLGGNAIFNWKNQVVTTRFRRLEAKSMHDFKRNKNLIGEMKILK